MVSMVVLTVLALASAAAVLVVASVAGGRGADGPAGSRADAEDLRAGPSAWRSGRRGQPGTDRVAEPVDASMEDFLAATAVQDSAYLGVEDLTETLSRARDRAARGVGAIGRR